MKSISKKIKTNIRELALLSGLMCTAIAARAQDETVRFEHRGLTVENAFLTIMSQTPYTFAINHSRIDIKKSVTLDATEMTLDRALRQILAGTGNNYIIVSKHIVLTRPESPVRPPLAKQNREQLDPIPANARPTNLELNPAGHRDTATIAPLLHRDPLGEIALAQHRLPRFAIKSNLLQAATLTPNLGIEIGLNNRLTLELTGAYNPWNLNTMEDDNKKLVYWIARPEIRYWSCERFNGHFLGANIFYGRYNISNHRLPLLFDKRYRYEGSALGAGISYGYNLIISRRWNLELNGAIGAARLAHDRYDCRLCEEGHQPFRSLYIGPTRLAITIAHITK
ncbi:MAG: DUF3575 domain-containing protein [Odoribacteraceae bacterium]|jgi:hypothetical protein|nr:DUF3575 domain-containing protein [Odoribacteraceae bacterium]